MGNCISICRKSSGSSSNLLLWNQQNTVMGEALYSPISSSSGSSSSSSNSEYCQLSAIIAESSLEVRYPQCHARSICVRVFCMGVLVFCVCACALCMRMRVLCVHGSLLQSHLLFFFLAGPFVLMERRGTETVYQY